jgi:hypothetical protein
LTIRVTNHSSEQAALEITGRPPAFDFVIEDSDGAVVWRRLRGDAVSMMLQVLTLEPEESAQLSDVWDQRAHDGVLVPPGLYRVRGMILTPDGERWTTVKELWIDGWSANEPASNGVM